MKNLFKFALVLAIVLVCVSCSTVSKMAGDVVSVREDSDPYRNHPTAKDNKFSAKITNTATAHDNYAFALLEMEQLHRNTPNFSYGHNYNEKKVYGTIAFSNIDLGKGFQNAHYEILITVDSSKDNEYWIYAKVSNVYATVKGKEIKVPALISNKIPLDAVIKPVVSALEKAFK